MCFVFLTSFLPPSLKRYRYHDHEPSLPCLNHSPIVSRVLLLLANCSRSCSICVSSDIDAKPEAKAGAAAKAAESKKRGPKPKPKDYSHIPSEEADGLPQGWTIKLIPRLTGNRSDKMWYSPGGNQFTSMRMAKDFINTLVSKQVYETTAYTNSSMRQGNKGRRNKLRRRRKRRRRLRQRIWRYKRMQ